MKGSRPLGLVSSRLQSSKLLAPQKSLHNHTRSTYMHFQTSINQTVNLAKIVVTPRRVSHFEAFAVVEIAPMRFVQWRGVASKRYRIEVEEEVSTILFTVFLDFSQEFIKFLVPLT